MSILDSPITWEILEEDFQKAFSSQAKTGPSRTFKAIGDGEGFLSKIALVDFDWIGAESIQMNNRLPKVAVIKICIIENSGTSAGNDLTAELNDNELEIYEATGEDAAIFAHIQKPKFYCGRRYATGAGYIAVEYVDGTMTRMPWQSLPDDVIRENNRSKDGQENEGGIRFGTEFARVYNRKRLALKRPELMKKWNCRAYYTIMKDLTQLETMEKRLRYFATIYPNEQENIDFILTKTQMLFGNYEEFEKRSNSTSRKLVFCHGDMWAPNLMHRICNKSGKSELVSLIDWQLQHIGSPTEDLIYLIFSGTSPETYTKMCPVYLKYFWDILSEKLTEEELPWRSFEELIEQFERTYSIFVMMLMAWMAEMRSELLKSSKNCPKEREIFDQKTIFMSREVARCLKKWF